MSNYDSQINSQKRQISNYNKAKEQITLAIEEYYNALNELNSIKGMENCEQLKKDIATKMNDLNTLNNSISNKISSANSTIKNLDKKKQEEQTKNSTGA